MSRDDPHFRLRIPEDLKKKIEVSAGENRRSLNAEIVARLAITFEDQDARELASELFPEIGQIADLIFKRFLDRVADAMEYKSGQKPDKED